MNITRAMFAAVIIWLLGVSAYIGSFFVRFMEDSALQANLVLTIAMIPSAMLGAHIYYRKGQQTNGFKLGIVMFSAAMILDAIITVPLFIIPKGGNHLSFFLDSGFWLIAMLYILVIWLYWRFKVARQLQTFQS